MGLNRRSLSYACAGAIVGATAGSVVFFTTAPPAPIVQASTAQATDLPGDLNDPRATFDAAAQPTSGIVTRGTDHPALTIETDITALGSDDRWTPLDTAATELDHLVAPWAGPESPVAYPQRSTDPEDNTVPTLSAVAFPLADARTHDDQNAGDGQTDTASLSQPQSQALLTPPRPDQHSPGRHTQGQSTFGPPLEANLRLIPAFTAEPPAPTPVTTSVTVDSGDTLMGLFTEAGASRTDAYAAIEALREEFDPRYIRPGHAFTLTLVAVDDETMRLDTVAFEPTIGSTIALERGEDDSFSAQRQDADRVIHLAHHEGVITSSLSVAGEQAGAPAAALAEMIRILSFDVDFQRDIRKGDDFELFHEIIYTDDGRRIGMGEVIFASMTLSGKSRNLYRFTDSDGHTDYYDEQGQGVRKALLRTPVNGARLSSGFGMRRHPILGYSKMHKGVDFAAPTGTPIYAAGDGVVEKASRNGGYGNYVRIRHNSEFKTAYAHLHRYGKGIKAGTRVEQGQVIGYVGSTGRSTGPHLHYEILRNGKQVNPVKVRFPSGKSLEGEELIAFKRERDRIDIALARTPTGSQVAAVDVLDETTLAD